MLSGSADAAPDSYRITSAIGMLRRS